ncbi:SIS domain-containing protein [Candidatus Halobeggiatoa sp. HSG11]|nr:SIS domain-containing protein [Candidatus Halobeggiatoa sp. HSG11]
MKNQVLALLLVVSEVVIASPTAEEYPHWKECFPSGTFSAEQDRCSKLQQVDEFIDQHANQNKGAVFDFDGTLYNEGIDLKEEHGTELNGKQVKVVGQPAWHRWAANHWHEYPKLDLFPLYRTKGNNHLEALINVDNYLEGKSNSKTGKVTGYHKFRQIGTLEAGMTPENMAEAVKLYLDNYSPEDYAFKPVLDIMQNMINNKFKVWIITGSNPYFVSVVLDRIEQLDTTGYFNFGDLSVTPHQPSSKNGKTINSRIVGNAAKVYNGKFTAVWDDRYLPRNKYKELYAVMKEGKRLVIRDYIEPYDNTDIIACVGNSGGDFEMMDYVLNKPDSKGIFINPRGRLKKLEDNPNTATFSMSRNLDPEQRMFNSINSLHQQFLDAEKDFSLTIPESWKDIEFKHIVGCGMGGSSLHYQVFNSTSLSEQKIVIANDYNIPKYVDLKQALVIGSSFSGGTEETISCFKQAIDGRAKTIAITGKEKGELAKIASDNNIPILYLGLGDIEPRVAIGKYFTYLVKILHKLGLSKMFDVNAVADNLKQQDLFPETQQLAPKMIGSTVMIYSGKSFSSTARIAKTIINENGKHPSFQSELPEANHNEIEGYINADGKYTLIFFDNPKNDHPKIRERFEKTVISVKKHSQADIINYIYQPTGNLYIERVFNALLWSHYLGYNLAIISDVKPKEVDIIKCFKEQLKGNDC